MSDDEQYDERNANVLYMYLSNAKLPDMGCSQTCECVLLLSLSACYDQQTLECPGEIKIPGFLFLYVGIMRRSSFLAADNICPSKGNKAGDDYKSKSSSTKTAKHKATIQNKTAIAK